MLPLLAALLVLGACARPADPPLVLRGAAREALEGRARREPGVSPGPEPVAAAPTRPGAPPPGPAQAAFERHCGACHLGDRETAKPAALAVFDLTRAGWPAGLTEAHLESMVRRVNGSSAASEEEKRAALSLIDEERARRASRKTGAPDG